MVAMEEMVRDNAPENNGGPADTSSIESIWFLKKRVHRGVVIPAKLFNCNTKRRTHNTVRDCYIGLGSPGANEVRRAASKFDPDEHSDLWLVAFDQDLMLLIDRFDPKSAINQADQKFQAWVKSGRLIVVHMSGIQNSEDKRSRRKLGAGGNPKEGEAAFRPYIPAVIELFSQMDSVEAVFSGSGGCGGGGGPLLAKALMDSGTEGMAIITKPLVSEGPMRKRRADALIEQVRELGLVSMVIHNNRMPKSLEGTLGVGYEDIDKECIHKYLEFKGRINRKPASVQSKDNRDVASMYKSGLDSYFEEIDFCDDYLPSPELIATLTDKEWSPEATQWLNRTAEHVVARLLGNRYLENKVVQYASALYLSVTGKWSQTLVDAVSERLQRKAVYGGDLEVFYRRDETEGAPAKFSMLAVGTVKKEGMLYPRLRGVTSTVRNLLTTRQPPTLPATRTIFFRVNGDTRELITADEEFALRWGKYDGLPWDEIEDKLVLCQNDMERIAVEADLPEGTLPDVPTRIARYLAKKAPDALPGPIGSEEVPDQYSTEYGRGAKVSPDKPFLTPSTRRSQ